MKDPAMRFEFLLQADVLMKSMDDNTLMKHCVDFSTFYDELPPVSLYNDIKDARVFFLQQRSPKISRGNLEKIGWLWQ